MIDRVEIFRCTLSILLDSFSEVYLSVKLQFPHEGNMSDQSNPKFLQFISMKAYPF